MRAINTIDVARDHQRLRWRDIARRLIAVSMRLIGIWGYSERNWVFWVIPTSQMERYCKEVNRRVIEVNRNLGLFL